MKTFNRVIAAGTNFNSSIVGHNNFVYPSEKYDTIIEDTECTMLSFAGGGSKAAVYIPESAVKHNGSACKNVIIWVEKSKISVNSSPLCDII